jgi:hypothetical protein
MTEPASFQDAVFYEVLVPTFADGNADGVGDLTGLTSKLEYLQRLGVNGLWLPPFYPSPWRDGGYDIADYRDVHPQVGTLDDFTDFLEQAHELGPAAPMATSTSGPMTTAATPRHRSSLPSPPNSTVAHVKHSTGQPQPRSSTSYCYRPPDRLLRRPPKSADRHPGLGRAACARAAGCRLAEGAVVGQAGGKRGGRE